MAHLEHYTKAAENLSITQPSLSHAISLLENELGVALFEKEGRNIVLTKYGKIFLKDVEKSLEILDSSVKSLKITGTGEGQIDLAFLRTLGTDFIPDIVHKFLKSNPAKSIDFKFHTGVTTDIIQVLKKENMILHFVRNLKKKRELNLYLLPNKI
ncbi:bacterial regulatory helix-turn-helix, lysR family protein [Clostridioides difficile DA00238]|nr:bacterial regulatory helix-turn-helix, lysR family protein [Clostridioides difficile DA00238]